MIGSEPIVPHLSEHNSLSSGSSASNLYTIIRQEHPFVNATSHHWCSESAQWEWLNKAEARNNFSHCNQRERYSQKAYRLPVDYRCAHPVHLAVTIRRRTHGDHVLVREREWEGERRAWRRPRHERQPEPQPHSERLVAQLAGQPRAQEVGRFCARVQRRPGAHPRAERAPVRGERRPRHPTRSPHDSYKRFCAQSSTYLYSYLYEYFLELFESRRIRVSSTSQRISSLSKDYSFWIYLTSI